VNSDGPLYSPGWRVERLDDCHFYHVMDIPDVGVVGLPSPLGAFDLRGREAEYLGHVHLDGRRVLEIGPASGALTFAMEGRGADVVAVELPPGADWDFVPVAGLDFDAIRVDREVVMSRLRNGFWLAHGKHNSRARVHYGDLYRMSEDLGRFDVAVLAAVLLHTRDPWRIVENCGRRADRIVIVERLWPELHGKPVVRFAPEEGSTQWDTWWDFSPDVLCRFLNVLGFSDSVVTYHDQRFVVGDSEHSIPMFTVVADRPSSERH